MVQRNLLMNTKHEGKKKGEIRQRDILEGEEQKTKTKTIRRCTKKETTLRRCKKVVLNHLLMLKNLVRFIRPATQDELKKLEIYSKDVSLQNTFKTSQPLKNNKTKYSSDKGDVVDTNLKNIKTVGVKIRMLPYVKLYLQHICITKT